MVYVFKPDSPTSLVGSIMLAPDSTPVSIAQAAAQDAPAGSQVSSNARKVEDKFSKDDHRGVCKVGHAHACSGGVS